MKKNIEININTYVLVKSVKVSKLLLIYIRTLCKRNNYSLIYWDLSLESS